LNLRGCVRANRFDVKSIARSWRLQAGPPARFHSLACISVASNTGTWTRRVVSATHGGRHTNTTKWRELRPVRCHAALLVLSRPLRAAFAVAFGQLDSGVLRGRLRTSPFSFRKMGIFQSELGAKFALRDPLVELLVRDKSFNINRLLPMTMSFVGGNMAV
jgi:hypothetical protein